MGELEVTQGVEGVTFVVRVAPRAARNAIQGVHAGALKVSLQAPPVEGEANAALCELLAARLCVPKRNVQLLRGQQSRTKTIRVTGVQVEAVHRLGDPAAGRETSRGRDRRG